MSEVYALQKQLDDAKILVERREQAIKLSGNPEFRKLIMQEFCVNECARYAQSSGDPSLSAEARADSLALAQAAGHLRRWLSVVIRMGDQAIHEMQSLEDSLQEARQESDE